MIKEERYRAIRSILAERQSATVQYLTKRLFVSEATIRRDLTDMEREGLLVKVWGGAMLPRQQEAELPAFVREHMNTAEKHLAASAAASLLVDGIAVFIDASTTCRHLVPYLKEYRHLTVITCSLVLAQQILEETDCAVHLIGGYVSDRDMTGGHMAVADVRQYHPDLMFFSCTGISSAYGLSCIESRSIPVLREMLRRADKSCAVMDGSKIGKDCLWQLAELDEVSYVATDNAVLPPSLEDALGNRLLRPAK